MTILPLERLRLTRQAQESKPRFNPLANRFFVEDQPVEPLLPLDHLTQESPLFARYRKNARWLRGGARAMMIYQAIQIFIVTVLMAMATSVFAATGGSGGYSHPEEVWAQWYLAITTFMMVASVGLSVLHDLYCLGAAGRQMRRDSLFEMVKLTKLSHRGIILSHYAAIRLRVWRTMSFIFALRLVGVVTFIAMSSVVLPMIQRNIYSGGIVEISFFDWLIQIGTATCLGAAFVMEARWRLNGVAARALTVAVSRDTGIPKEFVGLFNLLRLWLIQAVVLVFFLFLMITGGLFILGILMNWTEQREIRAVGGALALLVFSATILYAVRAHYLTILHRELRRAERLAFAPTEST